MKAPHFWSGGLDPMSREAAPLTRALLTPFEKIYLWGYEQKWRRAKPESVNAIVICIGNMTVGGTGKTPIVERFRKESIRRGRRAATLSRGYGGSLKGPVQVDPNSHTAEDVGDEPLMLSQTGDSWIGRDRVATAKAMVASGVDVIIMDDGYQNPNLKKDHSVLVIDAENPVGNGYCLPKGPMREPFSMAHERCSDIILVGDGTPRVFLGSEKKSLPYQRAHILPVSETPTERLVAFAGIGRPQKFFDGLQRAGGNVVETVPYGDHHPYSQSDLSFLRKLANEREARLITTTKDLSRIALKDRSDILDFPVTVVFDDEAVFAKLLDKYLAD